ncbi:hypothetical protein D9M69_669950 [compost metagenome]
MISGASEIIQIVTNIDHRIEASCFDGVKTRLFVGLTTIEKQSLRRDPGKAQLPDVGSCMVK